MSYQESYSLSSGPFNGRVLYIQHQHRSTAIWEENDSSVFRIRYHYHMVGWALHKRFILHVVNAGLYGVSRLRTITDHASVTELVERWRQEIHTFHLLVGEATLTL